MSVISNATMSLDGYIAYEDHTVGALFDWFDVGDIAIPSANPGVSFKLTPPSAEYWRKWTTSLGCLVVGRRLFDVTNGWGGTHPLGTPVVVLTHEPPTDWHPDGAENFHFVTAGVADAIARASELAGGRDVAVAAGTVAGQALEAGLLDAVAIDLAPVVLGSGRPYFGETARASVVLGDPATCIVAPKVTHLLYPLR